MGTWISHLRIAENLLKSLNGLDETAFMFGNLAPDCGKPNEDWTQFDPPKQVTHFLYKGEGEGRIRDLEFFQKYLAHLSPQENLKRYSFLLGYFFHLLCDSLWAKKIGKASKRDYQTLLESNRSKAWELMKEDWYGLDQKYVRDNKESIFWQMMLPAPNPPTYLPYLSQEAVNHQMDFIRQFYSQPGPEWVLERPYPYLNETMMDRFVIDSSQILRDIFELWDQLAGLETHSALSLIAPEKLQPYDAPLGDPS
jgi:hypothetical protein